LKFDEPYEYETQRPGNRKEHNRGISLKLRDGSMLFSTIGAFAHDYYLLFSNKRAFITSPLILFST